MLRNFVNVLALAMRVQKIIIIMDMIRKCKQNKNHTCTPCGQNGSIGKE